jgi:hypothetical protein
VATYTAQRHDSGPHRRNCLVLPAMFRPGTRRPISVSTSRGPVSVLMSTGCGLIGPLVFWPFARTGIPALALVTSILAASLFIRFVIIRLPHPPHAHG